MQIFIDADACPVVDIVEAIAKKYNIPLVLQCKAELTKLETDKVLCYENYKTGKISRDDFKEKKKLLDSRKKELIMSIKKI